MAGKWIHEATEPTTEQAARAAMAGRVTSRAKQLGLVSGDVVEARSYFRSHRYCVHCENDGVLTTSDR